MSNVLSKEQLYELYRNQGISVRELCALYDVSEPDLYRRLREYAIPRWDSEFLRFYHSYRADANKRGHSFELTAQQFFVLINGNCHYCGSPPYKRTKYKRLIRNGIDRANNAQGYTIENSRSCCHDCNFIKGSMPEQQFINCALRIASHQATLAQREAS